MRCPSCDKEMEKVAETEQLGDRLLNDPNVFTPAHAVMWACECGWHEWRTA